jgi:hypothetical protein
MCQRDKKLPTLDGKKWFKCDYCNGKGRTEVEDEDYPDE